MAAMRSLHNYQRLIHDTLSTLDDVSLSWLYRIVTLWGVSTSLLSVVFLLELIAILEPGIARALFRGWNLFQFILIAIAGCRSHLLAFGDINIGKSPVTFEALSEAVTKMEGLVSQQVPISADPLSAVHNNAKYQRSALSQELVDDVWQRVNDYMNKHEPFLDSELRMPQLAAHIGYSPNELSQAINRIAGQNFYEFVNAFRARKAKKLIRARADRKIPMLDIALEVGFASKATFYKHFKRHFNQTPVEYKKYCITEYAPE